MNVQEWINIACLMLATFLFFSCMVFIRPADIARPLLVGIMESSVIAAVIAFALVFRSQWLLNTWFGFVLLIYLLLKLRSLYSAVTGDTYPFVAFAIRKLRGTAPWT